MASDKKRNETVKDQDRSGARKLKLSKETLKDLAPGTRAQNVKAGRLPETKGCPYITGGCH